MKRLLILVAFWTGAALSVQSEGIVNNSSAGTITAEDSIAVLLKSVDSLGNPVAADSFYILVIGPKGDSVFSERGTNVGLARIDSVRTGSVTCYIFKAQVSDIDGPGVIGKYTLQVYPKKNSPLYITLNLFDFQITGVELSDALDSVGIAARGGIFTTAQRDSILSALADAVLGNKVWNRPYTSSFTAGSLGDSLNNRSQGEIFSAINDSARLYRQSARAIHDSTTTQSNLVAAVWNEDTTGNGLANSFGLMTQKAGAGATSSNWSNAQRDSVIAALADNAIANKVWKADTTGRASGANWFGHLAQIAGDSSLWAKPIDLWNQPFSSGFSSGSMGDSLRKPSYVGNLYSVSGNSTAASSFRSMLDGSGGNTLTLGLLNISGANGSAGSFRVTNSSGSATVFTGGSNGHGLSLVGQGTGSGLNAAGGVSGWKINADLHGSVDTVLKGVSGSGGGNDSSSIARWVWNTPHSNHLADGTFGQFLDAEVSSLAAGAGAWSYTVVARDTAINQAVPNAIVSIRNLEQTALIAVGTTNSLGRAWFNLNSGRYLAMIISPGYTFPAFDTITVLGPGADTVCGYQFDPGAPTSPALCRVYGYLFGVNGLPQSNASITAALPKGVMRTDLLVVSPFGISTVSDSTGYFFLDLIPSDSLKPSGASYEISISRPDGAILRKRMTIPAQPTWRLTW